MTNALAAGIILKVAITGGIMALSRFRKTKKTKDDFDFMSRLMAAYSENHEDVTVIKLDLIVRVSYPANFNWTRVISAVKFVVGSICASSSGEDSKMLFQMAISKVPIIEHRTAISGKKRGVTIQQDTFTIKVKFADPRIRFPIKPTGIMEINRELADIGVRGLGDVSVVGKCAWVDAPLDEVMEDKSVSEMRLSEMVKDFITSHKTLLRSNPGLMKYAHEEWAQALMHH